MAFLKMMDKTILTASVMLTEFLRPGSDSILFTHLSSNTICLSDIVFALATVITGPIYRSSHPPNAPHSGKGGRLFVFVGIFNDNIFTEIENFVALALYRRSQLKLRQAEDIYLQLVAIGTLP